MALQEQAYAADFDFIDENNKITKFRVWV